MSVQEIDQSEGNFKGDRGYMQAFSLFIAKFRFFYDINVSSDC